MSLNAGAGGPLWSSIRPQGGPWKSMKNRSGIRRAPGGPTERKKPARVGPMPPKGAKREPKSSVLEPKKRPFQGKLPRVLPCENLSIYYSLTTFRRSRGIPLGTENRPWNAAAARTAFFHDFFALKGAPGAPQGRKVSPRVPQRLPRATRNPSRIHQKSSLDALGVPRDPRGTHPPRK